MVDQHQVRLARFGDSRGAGDRKAVRTDTPLARLALQSAGSGLSSHCVGRSSRGTGSIAPPSSPPRNARSRSRRLAPVRQVVRIAFNPNATTVLFMGAMAIIGNNNMLAIILAGAAVIREREHGTLPTICPIMPLTPLEIAAAKVWANGLVITIRRRAIHLGIVLQTLLA